MTDTEPLDLDTIDWRQMKANEWLVSEPVQESLEDIPALIAEVRRLREAVETEHWGHMAAVALMEDAEAEVKRLRTQYLAIREAGQ